MTAASIFVFIFLGWGIGHGITTWMKESDDFLERNVMRFGLGFASFLTLGLLFNLLHIPLDWKLFMLVAIIAIANALYRDAKKGISPFSGLQKIRIGVYPILVIILFGITFNMHWTGANVYPYLEDDDAWSHATGVAYVAHAKTIFDTPGNVIQYVDPYPPLYDFAIGLLHQTNDSVFWSLKFFNAVFVSMPILFFYYFARVFTNSAAKAFFSTFILFAIPAFLSHFIWAISLAVPLYFVVFYAIEKIRDDKKWWLAAAICGAAVLVITPSHSAYFGLILGIYVLVKMLAGKKINIPLLYAAGGALLLSLALWWGPMMVQNGIQGTLRGVGLGGPSVVSVGGTGDRVYTFNDFYIAPFQNMINNPVGIGKVVLLLLLAGLFVHIFMHRKELTKNIVPIGIVFSVAALAAVLFFSQTYVAKPTFSEEQFEEAGVTTFSTFLSQQSFMLFIFLLALLAAVLLLWHAWHHHNTNVDYALVTLFWFMFLWYAVNAAGYLFKLSPFRAWTVLAIPVALLAGEALWYIFAISKGILKSINLSKVMQIGGAVLVVALVMWGVKVTSFDQKFTVNTAFWGAGGFWTYVAGPDGLPASPEIEGYLWFHQNIPAGTPVFTFSNPATVLGFDKYFCYWCPEDNSYQMVGVNQSAAENHAWFRAHDYQFVVLDGQAARRHDPEIINNKIQAYANSTLFLPVHQTNGMLLFQVV